MAQVHGETITFGTPKIQPTGGPALIVSINPHLRVWGLLPKQEIVSGAEIPVRQLLGLELLARTTI